MKKLALAKFRAVLAYAESTPRSVSQLWISANFSKNQHFSQRYSFKKRLTPRSVSLRGVIYFANISAKTNF